MSWRSVANRNSWPRERVLGPGRQVRVDRLAPEGRERAGHAGDCAEHRLRGLPHAELAVVPDVLHPRQHVVVGVQGARVARDAADLGVAPERPHGLLDRVRIDHAVRVGEDEDVAARPLGAPHERPLLADRLVVQDELEGEPARELDEPLAGAVGRAVVDDDHLEAPVGRREQRADAADHDVAVVLARDEGGHERPARVGRHPHRRVAVEAERDEHDERRGRQHHHAVEAEQRIHAQVGEAQAEEQGDRCQEDEHRAGSEPCERPLRDEDGCPRGDRRRMGDAYGGGGAAHSSILRPSSEYVQSRSGQASARKPWSNPGCTVWAMTRS